MLGRLSAMITPAFAGTVPVLSKERGFLGNEFSAAKEHNANCSCPTAQFKLPKLPSMPNMPNMPKVPSLPDLPSLPKLGGDKKAPSSPASPVKAAAIKMRNISDEARKAPSFSGGGGSAPARAVVAASAGVKFYKPKTARYVFSADSKGHGETAFDVRVGGPSTNARANTNGTFRNMDVYTSDPVWARPNWSPEDADVAVRTVFRNILGNAYLLEEEVAELATETSCFKISREAKEFVRAVGLSNAYKSRYFEPMSNMRFVELNFKHFLGRAPKNQSEISEHIQILVNEGYNAEINSYMDSEEYDTLWGDERIPQPNFRGGHDYNQGMNTLACLRGGYTRSDRTSTKATFAAGNAMNSSPLSILKGLPEAWRTENAAREAAGPLREFPASFWNPAREAAAGGGADWMARFGVNAKNWYEDSVVFKETMTPKLKHSDEEESMAAASMKYGSTMAKNYVGVRYQWSTAPVIEIKPPTSSEAANGTLSLAMKEIAFSIPSELSQNV